MANSNIFSFDAETNGLWGKAFSIGGILYAPDGNEIARFIGRCPIEGDVDGWVEKNVLPQMEAIPVEYASYEEMLKAFMDWRAVHKKNAIELAHMATPVEAKLFLDAHDMGIIGDWDAPYPLLDISAIPEINDSVDSYNAEHGISPDPEHFAGGTHNPLFDSAAAAAAYLHWLENH